MKTCVINHHRIFWKIKEKVLTDHVQYFFLSLKHHRMSIFQREYRQIVRLRNLAINKNSLLWLLKEMLITFLHLVTWDEKIEINTLPQKKKKKKDGQNQ